MSFQALLISRSLWNGPMLNGSSPGARLKEEEKPEKVKKAAVKTTFTFSLRESIDCWQVPIKHVHTINLYSCGSRTLRMGRQCRHPLTWFQVQKLCSKSSSAGEQYSWHFSVGPVKMSEKIFVFHKDQHNVVILMMISLVMMLVSHYQKSWEKGDNWGRAESCVRSLQQCYEVYH